MLSRRIAGSTIIAIVALTIQGCDHGSHGSASSQYERIVTSDSGVVLFHSSGCPDCMWVRENVFQDLVRRYSEENVCVIDVESPDILELIRQIETRHDRQFLTLAPILIVDGRVFAGVEEIRTLEENEPRH